MGYKVMRGVEGQEGAGIKPNKTNKQQPKTTAQYGDYRREGVGEVEEDKGLINADGRRLDLE